jgi:hypothetical protein
MRMLVVLVSLLVLFAVLGCFIILMVLPIQISLHLQQTQSANNDSTSYYNVSNPATQLCNFSYSFSPPISMNRAVQIALESGGWNKASLENRTIYVSLDYCAFVNNSSVSGFELLRGVTEPTQDYSPVQIGDTTYRYVWIIIISEPSPFQGIPPPGYYFVDAATAELLSIGIM